MNRYQDEDWQQEEQRRREAYYRMNSQNSNTPDALEQIFRGPLNWMKDVYKRQGRERSGDFTVKTAGIWSGDTGRKSRSRMER